MDISTLEGCYGLSLKDSLFGVVTFQTGFGVYIDLQIYEGSHKCIPAFAYWSGRIPIGSEVTCSVRHWPKGGKDLLVSIDSVQARSIHQLSA